MWASMRGSSSSRAPRRCRRSCSAISRYRRRSLKHFRASPLHRRSRGMRFVAAVHAARRAGPGFAQSDLVTVTTTQGRGLPLTGEELLRGLGAEIDGKHKLGLVARLLEDCAPDVLDRYGASLVTAWRLHGEESRNAWAYDAASMLGGARTAAAIARRFAGVSHPRAVHAIDCLARMRSPLATLELFAASRHWGTRGE